MALGTPYKVCGGNAAGGSTTLVVTVTHATSAGDAIAVWVSSSSANLSGVSDSGGNTYTATGSAIAAGSRNGQWYVALNTGTALSTSSTITLTCTGTTGTKTLSAIGCSGVKTSGALDQQPTSTTGNSSAPSITSGTLAQSSELALAGEVNANAGGAITWGGSFASPTVSDSQASSGNQYGQCAAITTSATSALTASGIIVSTTWGIALITLEAGAAGTSASAGLATGTGTGQPPVPSVGADAELAGGTGTALTASVQTFSGVGAPAGLATGTGTALQPSILAAYAGRAQVLIAWSTEPFDSSPAWTDVTPWVRLDRAMTMQRGRQDNVSEIQAGRITLTADNSDGRFTAGLSTSPYYPYVKIGRRIQVNVPDQHGVLHTRFDGLITELPVAWEGGPGIESLAAIQAADILAWLARQPQLLSWTQEEMLADSPVALWSLADQSNAVQATDQAGQGAQPLAVASQGDGTGAAAAGSGVPLTEIQVSDVVTQQQVTTVYTFTTPGTIDWTAPLGTLVSCDVICVAGGTGGGNGNSGTGDAGTGGKGGEYAEEPDLAVTPGTTYTGSVGAPGVPSGSTGTAGGNTTFTGDSVTVTAHGSGSGSSNTIHFSGASGVSPGIVGHGGGGGSSGGSYQPGNPAVNAAAGIAVTGGGAGGAGGSSALVPGSAGSQPGGGGGGGGQSDAPGGAGGAGQITITYTYIPPAASQDNSAVPSWLFTPSATLGARVLSGQLPQPLTAAAGFAAELWADFASFPAESVKTYTTPGAIAPWTCPPGITTADVACVAGGQGGGSNNSGGGDAGTGGGGGEWAEEPDLAVTPGNSYAGTVGAAGTVAVGTGNNGGNSTFTGDSVTVTAHGSGSGSSNTVHWPGGNGVSPGVVNTGGGGGSSGGQYQAGISAYGSSGNAGPAVAGGGAGGAGDSVGTGGTPGGAPGGGGGGGCQNQGQGGAGGPGQIMVTAQLAQSCLLTLTDPRGQYAIAVWVLADGHLQLASASSYGTRAPTWTTADAGQVPDEPFHLVVNVAVTTGVATFYVNDVAAGTVTLPAGASYTDITIGGAAGGWLGGWNGSAGLAAIYTQPLTTSRIGVHYSTGTSGYAGSSTGTMISRVAAYTGLPAIYYTPPAGTADPSYGLSTVSYYDLNRQQPLTQMQLYEVAEAGVLYVNAAGQLLFADRASRYAAGSALQPAYALTAGQYEPDTSLKSNDQYLCTEACYATNHLPSGYPVSNDPAQDDFGAYTASAGSPGSPQLGAFADVTAVAYMYSADDIMDAGNWQVNVLGEPVPRVPSLTVDLLTQPAAEFSIAGFYGLDVGSVVHLQGLPSQAPDTTGDVLAGYHVIEGVNETLSTAEHTVQLYTSPLAASAAWIPGDTLLGVLGTTSVVGRSQTPSDLGPPYFPVSTFGAGLNRTGSAGAQDWRTITVNTQAKLTPPLAIAQQQNAQTIATVAGQAVNWDTLLADTASGFTSLTTYTVPEGYAGWYWCAAVVQAATGTSSLGGVAAWFSATLSGVTSQWHAKVIPYLSSAPYTAVAIAGKIGPCSAGDTISVVAAAAGSPGSLPLGTADGGSMFTLYWQGYA